MVTNVAIPRKVISITANVLQLHAFGDASLKAMEAAVYLRAEDQYGNVSVNSLASKSNKNDITPTPP